MRLIKYLCITCILCACGSSHQQVIETPIDYVNPYMGNISHLLVPTYPTIHLPNSMLRVYPERADYTSDLLHGLPLIVTSHRGSSAFNLSPYQGNDIRPVVDYSYDQEKIYPYYYEVLLEDGQPEIKFVPSHQSALYQINFVQPDQPAYLLINSRNGRIQISEEGFVSGYQQLENNTRVYLHLEPNIIPVEAGILADGKVTSRNSAEGQNSCAVLRFAEGTSEVRLRYGISFISEEQARKNMQRELPDYDLQSLALKGRELWNRALSCIEVTGGSEQDKQVFYTSFYRFFERPVCISEDGRYFSAFDGKIHEDNGVPFIQMTGFGILIVQPILCVFW